MSNSASISSLSPCTVHSSNFAWPLELKTWHFARLLPLHQLEHALAVRAAAEDVDFAAFIFAERHHCERRLRQDALGHNAAGFLVVLEGAEHVRDIVGVEVMSREGWHRA